MTQGNEKAERTTLRIRRVARVWSVIVIAIALFIFAMEILFPHTEEDYPPVENLMPLAMMISVLGLAVAWRREGLGGVINVGFFLLNLALYWAIRGYFFPLGALLTLLPVVVPGILFLICWWRDRESDFRPQVAT